MISDDDFGCENGFAAAFVIRDIGARRTRSLSLFGLMLLLGESFRINFTLLRAHQPREDYMVFRVARDKDIVSYSIFL